MELTDHEEEGWMSLTRRWKLQMEATQMFPKVPSYPPNVDRTRLFLETAVLAAEREATA